MKKLKLALILMAQAGFWGCGSFNSAGIPADEPKEMVTRPPLSPDRTWVTPTQKSGASGDHIKPAAGDPSWNSKKPPIEPDKNWTIPVIDSVTVVSP